MLMNRSQFAELLGVTSPAVRQWIVDGMPAERTGNAGNAGYQIDTAAALDWLIKKRVQKAVKAERRRMERVHDLVPEFDEEDMAALRRNFDAGVEVWRQAGYP